MFSSLHFKIILVFCTTLLPCLAIAQDSIATPKQKRADIIITARLHSAGHFPYSGSYLNRNLNVDINLFYEHNDWGGFLFKSHDLQEKHSFVNYLQPGVFRKINLGKRAYVRIFGGYLFNQTANFSDSDSDVWGSLVGAWQPTSWLKVENTALFFNLTKSELHRQWANRVLISFFAKEFKFDVYLWNNLVFETNQHFTSGSVAVTLPKIKITDKLSVIASFAAQSYLSSYKPSYAMRDGFLFTMAVPFVVQ